MAENIEGYKAERTRQWGNTVGSPRGWDRWRSTTFLEVIGAKADRAVQAVNLMGKVMLRFKAGEITATEAQEQLAKLKHDCRDSIQDSINYSEKWLKKCDEDENFMAGEHMV